MLLKSFCFWGCVCLGSERIRRVELRCSNPSVSGVVCVFRSERIRRVVLCCSNPSVSGVVCV